MLPPLEPARVCFTEFQSSVDAALRREMEHALSGHSDHESGSLEDLTGLAAEVPPLPEQTNDPHLSTKQARYFARRRTKRAENKTKHPGIPRPSLSRKYTKPQDVPVHFNAKNLRAAKGAFVSQRQTCKHPKEYVFEQLFVEGFTVINWDGRTPVAIVDEEDRIISILAGRPQGEDWDNVHQRMSDLLRDAPSRLEAVRNERRGDFLSLSTGVSYGGGQTVPGNLAHGPSEKSVIERLITDSAFVRAAGFMCNVFAFYAPKLYEEYTDHLDPLFETYPHLKKPFPNSIFPTSTFNCGPRVVTLEHVDSTNVPFGLCAIFACGSYDPTKGGHLILFDLGLLIEFPPGSTILVPSGTLRHGNVAIQAHENRQSFTQYCPGGLFRWVAYGFKQVKASSDAERAFFERSHDERCKRAVGLFSKLGSLESDRQSVFNL